MMPDAKPKAHPLCFSWLLSNPACLNRTAWVLYATVALFCILQQSLEVSSQ